MLIHRLFDIPGPIQRTAVKCPRFGRCLQVVAQGLGLRPCRAVCKRSEIKSERKWQRSNRKAVEYHE
jgi:hypothetical protein